MKLTAYVAWGAGLVMGIILAIVGHPIYIAAIPLISIVGIYIVKQGLIHSLPSLYGIAEHENMSYGFSRDMNAYLKARKGDDE